MERQWLRRALYLMLAFSVVMWFITLAASRSSRDLVDVVRTEAAKTRYLVVFVVSLAGLAASGCPRTAACSLRSEVSSPRRLPTSGH
jgi:hypothetical protein